MKMSRGPFFLIFFIYFSLFETTKICFGCTKMDFFLGGGNFLPRPPLTTHLVTPLIQGPRWKWTPNTSFLIYKVFCCYLFVCLFVGWVFVFVFVFFFLVVFFYFCLFVQCFLTTSYISFILYLYDLVGINQYILFLYRIFPQDFRKPRGTHDSRAHTRWSQT